MPKPASVAPRSVTPANPWVKGLYAGTHTPISGRPVTFGPTDITAHVEAIRGQLAGGYMPPIALGHPKTDGPRVGSVVAVEERDGGEAWYKLDHLTPEFHESCQRGEYLFGSPSLNRDLSMRHLGALGAWEPALLSQPAWALGAPPTDLQIAHEDLAFGIPTDWGTVTASWLQRLSWRFNSLGRLFRAQRESIIAKDGLEAADKQFPSWEIENLETFTVPDTIDPGTKSETGVAMLGAPAPTPAPAPSSVANDPSGLQAQLDAANAKLRDRDFNDAFAAFGARLDQAANDGRLNTPLREALEGVHKLLSTSDGLSFGAADPIPAALATLVGALPKIVQLGELDLGAPGSTDTSTNPLLEVAQERAKAAKESR